jgi:hypothetical protein
MKRYVFFIIAFLNFSISLFSQNSVRNWITSIDKAISALEMYKQNRNPQYHITGNDDAGYIIYDVYGTDVEILPNGDARIIGRASLNVLNSVYEGFFNELIRLHGRPVNTGDGATRRTGVTSAIFWGYTNNYEYTYELSLNAFESTISLTKQVIPIRRSVPRIVGEGDENYNSFFYKVVGSSITITGYNGNSTSITIPSHINDLPVTIIGRLAFSKKNITRVTIPNTVLTIEEQAFSNNELTDLVIPESVINIQTGAFFTNKLSSLTLPNSIVTIGTGAFNTNNLTQINIPQIQILETNVFASNRLTSVTIPDTVRIIKNGAFSRNNISTVYIPDSVITIELAFAFNNISNIRIGSNVDIAWNNYRDEVNGPFGYSFKIYYDQNQKRSGTYLYRNNSWTFSPN